MNILWVITSLLLLHSCAPGFSMGDGIVGGIVSVPHSRPYMVYIHNSNKTFSCDGILIRKDFVLTAAHCQKSHLKVYLGVNDTRHLPESIEVQAFPHENFSMDGSNDIMLLKLKTPATLNKTVNIISLPRDHNDIIHNCLVIGWGSEDHHRKNPSRVLKEVNVTLVKFNERSKTNTLFTEGIIGPAQGDSGGPIVCGDAAQGIVSFYTEEKNGIYLTRYPYITEYLEWIESVINHIPSNL